MRVWQGLSGVLPATAAPVMSKEDMQGREEVLRVRLEGCQINMCHEQHRGEMCVHRPTFEQWAR